MKAGTAMDPHPESYEGDPVSNRRLALAEPPRDPDDEDEADEPAPQNPDDAPDDDAAALKAATAKLTG